MSKYPCLCDVRTCLHEEFGECKFFVAKKENESNLESSDCLGYIENELYIEED